MIQVLKYSVLSESYFYIFRELAVSAPPQIPGYLILLTKKKQDLSAKTISTWICKTIQLAYSFSNEELLNSMHVKAHDVRAISTSWALFNNAYLEEVLSAGFWRTENSFISHYLQSLATQAQSLYSLGPLVSAQRVVFPPASSTSGDSALG
ncbi:unnamed protein product [Mytilus edulis]|uniref:Uncharacterized protein n=1 Tax=Mytilus edulis TaxID=6550 RepID=A0A8S3T6Y5_MYTED|nr:unnamed protein product [Mytilus edulis]